MLQRTWTNWIFFEHLHSVMGADEVMAMLRGLPGGANLVPTLASAPGVGEQYHNLVKALSDSNVQDLGQGTVPYEPQA